MAHVQLMVPHAEMEDLLVNSQVESTEYKVRCLLVDGLDDKLLVVPDFTPKEANPGSTCHVSHKC